MRNARSGEGVSLKIRSQACVWEMRSAKLRVPLKNLPTVNLTI